MVAALLPLTFTACSSDDFSTNQFSGGVSLNVFGPNPVVRGGTLRFIGSNLDQVTKVVIPGVDPITDITVRQSGIPSEILVQVPKDGPEEGYVTLITATGVEITTKNILTYEESIEFTGFSPKEAMPGDVITIEGDYLDLIHEVIFAEEVSVPETEFLTHDRYTITVTVPDAARTGQIVLSDAVEELPNWIYSEEELTVGTPTVTGIEADRYKAGETVTFTGTYLNLVDYVEFNGAKVASTDLVEEGEKGFTVNEEGTILTLTLPAEAASGAVSFLLRSGVEVEVLEEESFEVTVPTELAVSPETVKAGATLTITGKDLDLVTGVAFSTATEGEYTDAGSITVTEGTVTVAAVPAEAVDGDVRLDMANGMSVTVTCRLVKPTVTSYSVNPVSAGGTLTINGTDLDLVSGVSIGGGEAATPDEGSTATSLTITVPMDSKSGTVVLNLLNGTSVEAAGLSVDEASFCYITELPDTEETEIKAGDLLAVSIANGDVLQSVEVNGAGVQYVLLGSTLYIGLPDSAGKETEIKLISSNGEISYTLDVISSGEVTTVIWQGAYDVGSWGGMGDLSWGGYDWSTASAGTDLTVYFTEDSSQTYWQIRIGNGSWSALPGTEDQYDLEEGATSFTVTLTQAMIDELTDNGGLVLTGCNYIVSKITLTEHAATETAIWTGSYDIAGWNAFQDYSWGGYDWSTVSAGQTLTIYYTLMDSETYWQMRVAKGDGWAALTGTEDPYDLTGTTSLSITLTATMVDELINSGGLILTGHGYTMTKITIS